MLTVVAPVTVQLNVAASPAEMLAGLASKELIAACWPPMVSIPPVQLEINIVARRTKGIIFFIVHLPILFLQQTHQLQKILIISTDIQ
jgi:hypothetical protein